MTGKIKIMALIIALSVAGIVAADWPQYYGPNRNSTSAEKGLMRTWPQAGPTVLWTVPVGIGFGGPAVVGGKVYLLDRDDKVGDRLRCLDFATGKELWTFGYNAPGRFDHPGSRSTPTVDGDYVYTTGPLGDLYAININTHKPVWHKNLWTDFGGGTNVPAGFMNAGSRESSFPVWGITQNPLIYRNLVIVAAQTSEAGVVAYDKLTGELKWKTAGLSGGAGYVSPSIVKVGGEDHVVMVTAAEGMGRNASGGAVTGIDPLSGKVLWTYTGWQCSLPVPHAVDAGEGRVLMTGGYRAGSAMIQVEKKADGSYGVTELFKNPDFGSHTQPPILYDGYFYAQYTINERSDGLVCMGMDGKVRWRTGEDPLFNKGGAILVDGLLLATDGNTMVYLIQPDPSGFKPLASATLLERGENWAPLALSDGKLLIRDQRNLKCLVVAQQGR
jgi:outer membrane protein assembly factor BamB